MLNALLVDGTLDAKGMFEDWSTRVLDDIQKTPVINAVLEQRKPLFIDNIKSIAALINTSLKADNGEEEKRFQAFFEKIIIQKLFQGQLNNINNKGTNLNIKLKEGESEILNIILVKVITRLWSLN